MAAIDGYDLISTSGGPTRREQLSPMRLNEFSRLWQICLRVSLWVRYLDFSDEIDRRLCLCVELPTTAAPTPMLASNATAIPIRELLMPLSPVR